MTGTPPMRRRLIGAALRRYRENMGYPLDTAASVLECDRSKISRIETGQRGIRAKELRELLIEYGVPQPEQEVLIAIAHADRGRGWWQAYTDILAQDEQDYILMESLASQVLGYEPQRIPDLLQTPRYATAQLAAAGQPQAAAQPRAAGQPQAARPRQPAGQPETAIPDRDRGLEVLLTRQDMLRERGARLEVVIGEAALHQTVGGPGVMREQLASLSRLADPSRPDPLVSIQILPFSSGAQPTAARGPMTVLRYAAAPSLAAVHLATIGGGVILEETSLVAGYVRAFAQLRAAACTPASSAALLRDMARD